MFVLLWAGATISRLPSILHPLHSTLTSPSFFILILATTYQRQTCLTGISLAPGQFLPKSSPISTSIFMLVTQLYLTAQPDLLIHSYSSAFHADPALF